MTRKPQQQTAIVETPTRTNWTLLAPLILIAGVVLAYFNSLTGPFIFDDVLNIRNNHELRRLWPIWKTIWGPLATGVSGRPVVQLSFALNYAVHKFDVRGYHVTNLFLHIATSLTLFGILRRTFISRPLAPRFGPHAAPLALIAAMIWQVHPLLSDSVTYLSGRTEILAALFMLLTLYSAIRSSGSAARARLWQLAAVVFFFIDTGCKEIAAATPFLVLIYDRLFLSESFRQMFRERRWLYAGMFACLVFIPLNLYMADFHRSALVVRDPISSWDYLKIQAEVLVLYLRLSFWPHPLIIDYSDWKRHPSLASVLPHAVLIASMLAVTVYGLLRRWPAAFAGAWCFLILGPTSSVLPLPTEIVTERRMYLPLMAIVTVFVVVSFRLLQRLVERFPRRKQMVRVCAGALVVTILGAATQRTLWRNEDYKNPIGLWSDVINHRPNNARAYDNLAFEFLVRGEDAAAKACFLKGLEMSPGDPTSFNNIATILMREGDQAGAIRYLEEAIRLDPRYGSALTNLGTVYYDKGDFAKAEGYVREALKLQPNRPFVLITLGKIRLAQGDTSEAEQLSLAALRVDPASTDAHKLLADVRARR